jgi:iron complex outermembrane recepter protein
LKLSASRSSQRLTRPAFCLRPLAAACALLVAATGNARAQSAPPVQDAAVQGADAPVATVVVTGLRRSLEDSVTAKRNSDSIIEVVSAEDLGKLPDASIAESLARLPGVTGQRGPDGRVNVISIRGLSPEFSGSLLNGREVVSSNDARAVEYDQFPSELIGSATVYKTPDATLIGQGLSGTVDLRSRRPLDTRGRQVAVNLRGEKNSNGQLVPGVAPKLGSRFSVSFVDQFANNTIGIAAGFARLDVSTQVKQTQNVMYADFTPYGLPVNGNAPSQYPMADGTTGQSMLPMYWTATTSSKRNTRDGLMAVLEYKPNRDLHSQLDLYYSKFNTHEVGGIFLMNMWGTWAGGAPNLTDLGTTQVGKNTFTTSATADRLPVTTGNFDTKRKDDIAALGWNTELRLDKQWKATADLSWSRDVRDETYSEVYEAPFNSATQSWTYGGFKWNVPVTSGAAQTFTPLNPTFLSDPNTVKLGDQDAFNFVGDQDAYTGAVRTPHIKDEIKALRFSLERRLDNGIFSNFVAGVNHTQRSKDVAKNESRLLMQKDANGNYIRDVPQSALRTPFDMSWAGIPSLMRIDVPALAQTGALSLQPLFAQMPDNNSDVREKVSTAYGMLNIDTEVGPVGLRGNVGLQAVHTDQRSSGWVYRGNNANPDINLLSPLSGGATYNDYLPSLNLVGQFKNGWQARLGLAKTMARPNIVDMRAGMSTPTIVPDPAGTPHAGEWTTTYSGNPALEPWRAKSVDLSLEKYFGARSYLSVAVFQKNLLNYVFSQQTTRDNTDVPVASVPAGVTPKQYGAVIMPMNGHGGKLKGLEVSAALEGGLVTPMLDGYGVVFSGSHLVSHLKDQDGQEVSLNGLSGKSASVTAYYEKSGFSARVSQRYRSAFTATTRDIFLNATTRRQEADRTVDMQLGYEFGDGAYKGLSILLQVNNLTDKPTVSSVNAGNNAPDTTMMLPQYTYYYGRQVLLGANYKF